MDPSKVNDITELQALLELMGRYGLSELELENDTRKIRLRKPEPPSVVQAIPVAAAGYPPALHPLGAVAVGGALGGNPGALISGTPAEPPRDPNLKDVNSPMVGTFYRSPSPEADPFVREGDRVEDKSVLCIIEAMKVMNEITSGIAGVVKEILLKNGEPVEFGQPLFRIAVE